MHEELKEQLKQIEIDYRGKSFYSVFVAGSLRTPDFYKDRGFDARRKGVQVWVKSSKYSIELKNHKTGDVRIIVTEDYFNVPLSTTAQIS
jgi:hypothetical protein